MGEVFKIGEKDRPPVRKAYSDVMKTAALGSMKIRVLPMEIADEWAEQKVMWCGEDTCNSTRPTLARPRGDSGAR